MPVESGGTVGDVFAIGFLHGKQVLFGFHGDHLCVALFLDTENFAAALVAQYVAHVIACRPGTIRAGHIRARSQHAKGVVFRPYHAERLQLGADGLIDLAARGVVG